MSPRLVNEQHNAFVRPLGELIKFEE